MKAKVKTLGDLKKVLDLVNDDIPILCVNKNQARLAYTGGCSLDCELDFAEDYSCNKKGETKIKVLKIQY